MSSYPEPVTGDLVFAADLGGTHLRAALIDEAGKIHVRLKQGTPHGENPEVIINALTNAAAECKRQFGVKAITAASIMVPGTVDTNNAVVVQAPNLPSLDNFGLKAVLQERFGCPVVLENDANAAAIGEMWLGAARNYRSIICITLGTGVGGGLILDGKLWRGADGAAGELGHASVDPFSNLKCKCGNTGCLEMFASATAIVRMGREVGLQLKDKVFNERLCAEKIYEAAEEGNELALEIFKKVGTYLGVGLSNLINLLNPEIIVIGGGVANGWKLFEKDMRKQVAERAVPTSAVHLKIEPAECGDSAGLLGAARLAFDHVG